jgi:hypothetical protein
MAEVEIKAAVAGEVSVRTDVPKSMPVTYSDYGVVQSTPWEIRFSFFQLYLPLGDPEMGPDGKPIIDAHCVGQIAMPTRQAVLLYEQLHAHLKRLREDQQKQRAEPEQK